MWSSHTVFHGGPELAGAAACVCAPTVVPPVAATAASARLWMSCRRFIFPSSKSFRSLAMTVSMRSPGGKNTPRAKGKGQRAKGRGQDGVWNAARSRFVLLVDSSRCALTLLVLPLFPLLCPLPSALCPCYRCSLRRGREGNAYIQTTFPAGDRG